MKLITNGTSYAVTTVPTIGAQTVRVPLASAPPGIGDTVDLVSEDGLHLRTWHKADFLRAYLDGTAVVLTQEPEPKPIPAQPSQPQSDPMADLAEAVSDLMVEVDKIKLGVTDQ